MPAATPAFHLYMGGGIEATSFSRTGSRKAGSLLSKRRMVGRLSPCMLLKGLTELKASFRMREGIEAGRDVTHQVLRVQGEPLFEKRLALFKGGAADFKEVLGAFGKPDRIWMLAPEWPRRLSGGYGRCLEREGGSQARACWQRFIN